MIQRLFPLALLFLSITSYAQRPERDRPLEKINITGTIVDLETGRPLEYATLVLQHARNPELVTGGITDAQGKFNVEIQPGVYHLRAEYISYTTYERKNQKLFRPADLGTISLEIDVEQLNEVEVVGEKTTVEVRLDKKIYNIGKDLTTSGATVSDALNNVPSVTVDVEGAISLRGNENVRILINGKPSALAGFGSTDALQQLPADVIEKVEVITSPSARYDAEGTAGILNIVLKREKTLGFNGSLNLYAGHPTNAGATVNANLRTDKFNFFTTLGYRSRKGPGNAFFDNTYVNGDFNRITEDREYDRENEGYNLNLGTEYFFSKTASITASFFKRVSEGTDITSNTTERFTDVFDSSTLRKEIEDEDDDNWQVSLNYQNTFDNKGEKLTADFQYSEGDERVNTLIDENQVLPAPLFVASDRLFESELQRDILLQADYVLPIGEHGQFEAGYRGDLEDETTVYDLERFNDSLSIYEYNTDLSNTFTYHEDVHALYTQYGNKLFKKVSFLLGLRLEQTRLKGILDSESEFLEEFSGEADLNFDKEYLGLFPTANLTYEIAENENITLGYNRRINRPRGWFINPFPSLTSRTNIFQGNPDLDPAFSHTFDLGYLKRWKKLTLTSSVYYQHEDNAFGRVQEASGIFTEDGIEIIRSIPFNLATNKRTGFEGSVMYNPSRKVRLGGSFNLFRFNSEGSFNGQELGTTDTSWFSRFSSKVTLPAKIDWQTSFFFIGPRNNAQTESKSMYSLDLAFSKDILKDNGTISLNVRDLFNTRKRQSFTQTDRFTSRSEFQWRQRQITLSFMYRINQKKKRQRQGRGNGGMDEGEFEG